MFCNLDVGFRYEDLLRDSESVWILICIVEDWIVLIFFLCDDLGKVYI